MPEQPDAPDPPVEPYEHTHLRPPPPASPPPPAPPPAQSPPPPAWAPPPPAPAPAAPWGQAPPPAYAPGPPSFPQGPPSYGGSYRPTVPLPPGGPSPSGRNGLFVGLLVVTAIGLVSVLVLGLLLWTDNRDDDADRATDTTSETGDSGADGAAPSAGSATAPSPPSPSETAPSETAPPSEEPSPSDPPSEEPPPEVDPSSPFSYTEYGNDWDFQFGDVALKATFENGWDYDSCGPVENAGALTDLGCKRASEWTYRALGGDLALTHLVLTMDSAKAAKRAIDRALIKTDSWKVQDASLLTGRDGRWRANAQGEFIVLTVETHEPGVRRAKSDEFLQYANADILGALAFRF